MANIRDTIREVVRDELLELLPPVLEGMLRDGTTKPAIPPKRPTDDIFTGLPPRKEGRPWPDDLFTRLERYATQNAEAGEEHTGADWLRLIGEPDPLVNASAGDRRAFSLAMRRAGFRLGRSAANTVLQKDGHNLYSWLVPVKREP